MISMRISSRALSAGWLAFVFVVAAGCGGSTGGSRSDGAAGASGDGGNGGGGATAGSAGATGGAGAGGQTASGGSGSSSAGAGGKPAGSEGGAGTGGKPAGSDGGAGSTDGAAVDTGSASSGCTGKTYKLCEDFESGTVGKIPNGWTALQGYAPKRGGTVLANDAAHSGTMSLKSDGMSTGLDRVQRALASLGPTATKQWGRLFYKVGTPLPKPTSGVIHITMAALEGTTENRVVDTVVATNGTHQWLFNIPDDSCCAGSDYKWSFDAAWHCAEWNIDVATSSFRFFSDGQEVTQLAFTGKTGAHMSNYGSIGLGTIYYQAPPAPVVMWFDDLAIDDNRVGCL
jgi:hypothetical protein